MRFLVLSAVRRGASGLVALAVALGALLVVAPAAHAANGHITGTVHSSAGNGTGVIANVPVVAKQLVGGQWQTVATTQSAAPGSGFSGGSYDLSVPPGTYRVFFNGLPAQYRDQYYNKKTTIDAAQDVMVADGATVAGIDASLDFGGDIHGRVTAPNGSGVSAAYVQSWRKSGDTWTQGPFTFTDSSGNYTLTHLETNTFRIKVSADSFAEEYYNDAYTLETATDVAVTGGLDTNGVDVQLGPGASISGTVKNAASAGLYAEVHVFQQTAPGTFTAVPGKDGFSMANQGGAYTVSGLVPGTYRLQFAPWDELNPGYAGEYYDNVTSLASATDIVVPAITSTITGKDAVLTATGPAPNTAPVIAEAAPSITTAAGATGTADLTASDADGDTLTWSIGSQGSKGTASVSGTGAAKTVTYTPTAGQTGADSFTVQVADGHGGTDTVTVSVTITPAAPTLTVDAGGPYTVVLGQDVNVGAVATPAGQNDFYTWDLDNDGAYDDTANQNAIWVSSARATSGPGTYTIRVKVADGHGGEATDTATVTVTAAGTPPVVTPPTTTPTQKALSTLTVRATGGTRVGEVRVAESSFDGDPTVSLSYRWQVAGRGGTWIWLTGPDATKRSYELPPEVMKINVRAVVTATRGGESATVATAPLVILPGNHNASKLRIVGKGEVGKQLTAKVKIPKKADDLEITYVWTIVGGPTKIVLAGKKITLPAKAAGKKVFVDIRITAPGYHNQELRSAQLPIS